MGEAKDYAINEIKKAQLVTPKNPRSNDVELPKDLTEIASKELGKLLTEYTGYSVYADYLVSMVVSDVREYASSLEAHGARVQTSKEVQEKFKNVSDKSAKVILATETERKNLNKLKAKRDLAKSLLKGYERITTAISREISRRQTEAQLTIKNI